MVRLLLARPGVRRAARAPAASLLSQVVGLAQVGLLLVRAGANEATDAFFYLFTLGLIPTLMLITGIVYPRLVSTSPMSSRGLQRMRLAAPTVAAALVVAGSLWIRSQGRLHDELVPLACLLLLNAVLQARLYFRAAASEAGGVALWSAGIALPANAGAVALLLLPWSSPAHAVTAMAAGLLGGNAALLIIMRRRRVGQSVLDGASEEAVAGGSGWFFARGVTGYASHLALSSAAVLLPASSVTILNVAAKLVTAVTGTFTNAILPALIHHRTETPAAAKRFLRWLVGSLAGISAVLVPAVLIIEPDLGVAAVLTSVWLIGSSASAVAQRTAYRFLVPNAFLPAMLWAATVVVAVLLAAQADELTIKTLIGAYAILDVGTAAILLWLVRDRRMAAVLGAGACGVAVLLTRS